MSIAISAVSPITTCIDFSSVSVSRYGHLVTAQCYFDSTQYNDNDFDFLAISLPDSLQRAVAKRKSEFLAGRYLAKIALHSIGRSCHDIAIGKNRAPVWPRGILGSISHTFAIAQCVITDHQYYQHIGLDIEHLLTSADANNIASSIVQSTAEYLPLMTYLSFNTAITLIFSAKESLFKAIYKEVGKYFDFSAAQVTSFEFTKNELTLTIIQELSLTIPYGKQFQCKYEIRDDLVKTLITN
jgi:4'-phosphopantetheinyl transferase EntD